MNIIDKYQKLICHLAWNFARRYSRPFEEVKEEATYILILQLSKGRKFYDPSKASEITRVYQIIRYHLLDICTRSRPIPIPFSCLEKKDERINWMAKQSWMSKILQEVGEEGKDLIQTILHAPDEILQEMAPRTRARARKAIREWFIDVKDWKEEKLEKTWREVTTAIEGRAAGVAGR